MDGIVLLEGGSIVEDLPAALQVATEDLWLLAGASACPRSIGSSPRHSAHSLSLLEQGRGLVLSSAICRLFYVGFVRFLGPCARLVVIAVCLA